MVTLKLTEKFNVWCFNHCSFWRQKYLLNLNAVCSYRNKIFFFSGQFGRGPLPCCVSGICWLLSGSGCGTATTRLRIRTDHTFSACFAGLSTHRLGRLMRMLVQTWKMIWYFKNIPIMENTWQTPTFTGLKCGHLITDLKPPFPQMMSTLTTCARHRLRCVSLCIIIHDYYSQWRHCH